MTERACATRAVGSVLALAASLAMGTSPLRAEVDLSMAITVNTLEGTPLTGCRVSARVDRSRTEWWATFAQTQPAAEAGWEKVDDRIECGLGPLPERQGSPVTAADSPYLIAKISTVAGLLPATLVPERVVLLDLSVALQQWSGSSKEREPDYRDTEIKRKFYFLDGGDAFVPLLVADEAEQEALGLLEVVVQISAQRVLKRAVAPYGTVSVLSGEEGAEVLLDGGVVEKVPENGELTLRNVPVGPRLVGLREASGREKRKFVRVTAERTALVELGPRDSDEEEGSFRLETLGKNAEGFEEYRRESDGTVVVKIPEGEFLMGNSETEGEPLEHRVWVSEFLMDKTGVTWGQYKKYAMATGTPLPPRDPYWGIHDDHPAVYVTWEESKAYCEWAGGRLPTEAEREKAARGTDGRMYPWGDEEPNPRRAVFRRHWGYEATDPVGTHPAGASPYGLLDMGGNVWEWCADWYDREYYEVSPYRDPRGPAQGNAHVLRGGSWDSRPSVLSASCRNWGHRGYREGDFGFRCAMSVPK